MTAPWRDRVSDPTRGFRKTLPDMTPAEHLALIDGAMCERASRSHAPAQAALQLRWRELARQIVTSR